LNKTVLNFGDPKVCFKRGVGSNFKVISKYSLGLVGKLDCGKTTIGMSIE